MAGRDELRLFVERHRAAQEREREERRRRPLDPARALARGLRLIELARPLLPASRREPSAEDLAAYDAWARLRRPHLR